MAKDNAYPQQGLAEETLIRHAIAKAKSVGCRLVISGYARETVSRMELAGDWCWPRFVLSATPLIEATVAFGNHDWVHRERLVREPNKEAFLYNEG